MTCTHDIIEKDNACADGMCPICLAAELDGAVRDVVRGAAIIANLNAEIDRLTAVVKAHEADNELRYFGEIPL